MFIHLRLTSSIYFFDVVSITVREGESQFNPTFVLSLNDNNFLKQSERPVAPSRVRSKSNKMVVASRDKRLPRGDVKPWQMVSRAERCVALEIFLLITLPNEYQTVPIFHPFQPVFARRLINRRNFFARSSRRVSLESRIPFLFVAAHPPRDPSPLSLLIERINYVTIRIIEDRFVSDDYFLNSYKYNSWKIVIDIS